MMENNELDLNYLKQKIQNILNREFADSERRNIKEFDDRFNFCCNICGDSQKSNSKKRMNFYFSNLRLKCFNCGQNIGILEYLKQFKESIDIDERVKLYNYIDANVKFVNRNNDYIITEMDKLIELDKFVDYFNNRQNSWLSDIKPVELNSRVYQHLKYERFVNDFSQIYQGVYRVFKNGKLAFFTPVMIFLNISLSTKKIIGIQLRNLEKDKSKRFFKIVEFEEIYNYMNPNSPLDDLESISYNKLSHFFNILNVNFDEKITIFESFIDSLFVSNSIGLIGTNSVNDVLNFLCQSDDLDIRFFLDGDDAGNIKSEQLLKKGQSVFLWNKLFEQLLTISKDKNKAEKIYKNIKDLNELVVESKNPNVYDKLNLTDFFSKDEFDILYIHKKSNQQCQKYHHKKK